MPTTRHQGRVKGRIIELDDAVALPDDTAVEVAVTPVISVEEQRELLRSFLSSPPRVSREDVDALMQAINEPRPPSKVDAPETPHA